VRYVMTWTAFLAAAWSVRDREHITVEIIMPWLGPKLRRVVDTLRWLLWPRSVSCSCRPRFA
jgi:TRAP-type C4-dicarboxylate transport system permease small subunit